MFRSAAMGKLLFVVSASLIPAIAAEIFAGPNNCCEALRLFGLEARLDYPGYESYTSQVSKYFSRGAHLTPHCFLAPESTFEVSLALQALVRTNKTTTEGCKFAIRSGGHTHFAGAAGIQDGVTIDLGRLNGVQYHESNNSVLVGPGAVWGDVYRYLDALDPPKMVVGGRSASVGVGGMVLGGGNSYHAARKGFVCDNVVRFEVVLGDGRIVTASANENSDLFQVLKGGSSNFGIVTRYELAAFEGGDIFGGLVLYPENTAEDQFSALLNFGSKIAEDSFSSAIVIGVYMSAMRMPLFMNAYEYTKKQERPAVFREFFDIPGNISDTTGIRNMTSLAEELEESKDYRISFSTLTFKADTRVLRKAHEAFKAVVAKLEEEAIGDWAALTLYQPLPAVFTQHSARNGGNVLGLDRFAEDLILYEPYLKWQNADQDALFQGQAQWLRDEIEAYAMSIGAENEFIYLVSDVSQNIAFVYH